MGTILEHLAPRDIPLICRESNPDTDSYRSSARIRTRVPTKGSVGCHHQTNTAMYHLFWYPG